MGSGIYSVSNYSTNYAKKVASGTTFAHSARATTTGIYEVHPDLDPQRKATAGLFKGKNIREARDNFDHPNSVPVVTLFDSTGSMAETPRLVQKKLGELFGMILRKGYIEDPALMTGSYGDVRTDHLPLQISQFEAADDKILDALNNLVLEGNGGGNSSESAALAWYFLAYHTATDAWDKRHKKGYVFFIADEVTHDLTREQVKKVIGDGEPAGPLDMQSLAKKLQEQWEVYVLLVDNYSAQVQGSKKFYTNLFGEKNVLVLEDDESAIETIALTLGIREGTVDIDDGIDDLKSNGSNALAIRSATNAVKGLANLATGGAVAKANGSLNLGKGRAARL